MGVLSEGNSNLKKLSTSAAGVDRGGGGRAILLLGVAAGLVVWSWGTWIDPIVDSGRELYVAWRLSLGDLLYRDVAYFNGPLSPYWNALWFKLLGPSIALLTVINGAIAVAIFTLLYAILRRIRGGTAATLGCLSLLVLVAIPPRSTRGAFTYLAPYSHELTHGLFLLLLVIFALSRAQDLGGRRWLFGAGLAAGACLLTKPEIGLAVGMILAAWGFFLAGVMKGPVRAHLRPLIAGLAVPPAVAWSLFLPHLGVWESLAALATPLASAVNSDVRDLLFYRAVMGTDDLGPAIRSIVLGTVAYGGIVGIPFLALRRAPGGRKTKWHLPGILLGVLTAVAVLRTSLLWIHWWYFFVPLQALAVFIMLGEVTGKLPLLSMLRGPEARLPATLLSVLATGLLAKVFFNTSVVSYGFVLTTPALTILITAVCVTLPDLLSRRSRDAGRIFRAYSLALLFGILLVHLVPTASIVNSRSFPVGTGRDGFLTDPVRGEVFNGLMAKIGRLSAEDRLVVVPEGSMINYLARRPSSVPFPTILPPEQALFGSEEIERAFFDDPPEWIATWDREGVLYRVFGEDYGIGLSAWIKNRYDTTWTAEYVTRSGSTSAPDTVAVRLLRLAVPGGPPGRDQSDSQ
jgi:hypothetical protein